MLRDRGGGAMVCSLVAAALWDVTDLMRSVMSQYGKEVTRSLLFRFPMRGLQRVVSSVGRSRRAISRAHVRVAWFACSCYAGR